MPILLHFASRPVQNLRSHVGGASISAKAVGIGGAVLFLAASLLNRRDMTYGGNAKDRSSHARNTPYPVCANQKTTRNHRNHIPAFSTHHHSPPSDRGVIGIPDKECLVDARFFSSLAKSSHGLCPKRICAARQPYCLWLGISSGSLSMSLLDFLAKYIHDTSCIAPHSLLR